MGIANTYAVFVANDEYTCRSIYDDKGEGIDIYDADNKHVGEIYGISIPDIDCDVAETAEFEERVINYIEGL